MMVLLTFNQINNYTISVPVFYNQDELLSDINDYTISVPVF